MDLSFASYRNEVVIKLKQQIEEMAQHFGVPIVTNENQEEYLVGIDVLSAEEAQEYAACDIDVESPEHLLEQPEDLAYTDYRELYIEHLQDAIDVMDEGKVHELLSMGVTLYPSDFNDEKLANKITNMDLSYDEFYQLVKPAIDQSSRNALRKLFLNILNSRNWTQLEYLFEAGYDVGDILFNITSQLFSPDLPNDIFKYIIGPRNPESATSVFIAAPEDADPEKMELLISDYNVWLDLGQLYAAVDYGANHILKVYVDAWGYEEIKRFLDEERLKHSNSAEALEAIDNIDETLYKLSTA